MNLEHHSFLNMYQPLTRCSFGNGLATEYFYNPYGLLTGIQTGNKIEIGGEIGIGLEGKGGYDNSNTDRLS